MLKFCITAKTIKKGKFRKANRWPRKSKKFIFSKNYESKDNFDIDSVSMEKAFTAKKTWFW
jgi:hypothetical protein